MHPQQLQSQRKSQQIRAHLGLVGRPYDGDVIIAEPESAPAPPPPLKKKIGRPPKGAVAMTPAQRQERKRHKDEIDVLVRQQGADRFTGGYGKGWFIKYADKSKGELITGGYDSAKCEAVDAAHQLDGTRRVQSSGAGSDSDVRDRPVFFDVKKYSADFTHRWDLQQEEEEWKRILAALMVRKMVCLVCDCVIGAHPDLATPEETEEHLRTHPQEGEATIELRCAVCDEADTDHIRECELTLEDKKHNRNCKELEDSSLAGWARPRKMSGTDKAHRTTVSRVRKALRSTVKAIKKAVQATGHILMVDKKYREFLKPTASIPGHEFQPAVSPGDREAREDSPTFLEPAIIPGVS
jgi:hypothetical protein